MDEIDLLIIVAIGVPCVWKYIEWLALFLSHIEIVWK